MCVNFFSAECNSISFINIQNQEDGVLQIWNMELRLLNVSESCNSVVEFDLIKQDDQQFWKMLRECGLNWDYKNRMYRVAIVYGIYSSYCEL